MQNKMVSITCEKDLEIYEKHLQGDLLGEMNFKKHLINCKGKMVLVETCVGGNVSKKIGKLLEVGDDYIVLKNANSCQSTIIPASNIYFITVSHCGNGILR